MPEIDLGPNDYRKQVNGRWHLPDDPKLCRNMFFVVVAVVAAVFLYRSAGTNPVDIGLASFLSFCGGILFATWKRGVY